MTAQVHISPGDQYGFLVVVDELPRRNKRRHIRCLCACGSVCCVLLENLRSANTVSCGCMKPRLITLGKTRHGHASATVAKRSREWAIWGNMKQRCSNPNNGAYANYGGRGISVCERWSSSYSAFLADMGRRPSPQHSIDRIDVNGDYEPGNCRWATPREQGNNTRANVHYTLGTVTRTETEWARSLGLSPGAIRRRLRNKWSLQRALTTPKRQ